MVLILIFALIIIPDDTFVQDYIYSVVDYFSILMKLSTNNINEGIAINDRINNMHRDLFTD